MPAQAMIFLQFRFVEYCPHHGFPDFARTVETPCGLTAVSDMSHIRSAVHRSRKCRLTRHRMGQMNLHGYHWREGIAYGSPEALISPISISIPSPARTAYSMCWARTAETFAGFKQSRSPVVNISAIICKELAAETAKLANCLPGSGITLPTREMWAAARRRDALRHLQPESSGGANRFYLYINYARRVFIRLEKQRYAREAKQDAFTTLPRL